MVARHLEDRDDSNAANYTVALGVKMVARHPEDRDLCEVLLRPGPCLSKWLLDTSKIETHADSRSSGSFRMSKWLLDTPKIETDRPHDQSTTEMRGTVRSVRPLSSPRVLLISGTPISESPANAFSVLKILDPDRVPGRTRFENHFIQKAAVQAGPVTINKPVSYVHLDELKRLIEGVSVRRLKCDIRGMPDRTEQTHNCQPTKEQAAHYAEILRGILADIEGDPDWAKTLDLAVVKLLRLRQVLSHPSILGLSGDSGKLLELDGLVEEVLSNPAAKLVIWCQWNAEVDIVARRYAVYKPVTIDQRTTQEELAKLEHTFDSSDQRIAIGTPQKAGTGVDFLARARTAIYIEKTYSLVSHRQSIDRIVRRVGDDNPSDSPAVRRVKQIKRSGATIIYLHVPNSVDDVVSYVLGRKIDLGDSLLTNDQKLLEDGKLHLLQMLRGGMRL